MLAYGYLFAWAGVIALLVLVCMLCMDERTD